MNNFLQELNKFKTTGVKEHIISNNDVYFGTGKVIVCNIKIIDICYQFMICETTKYRSCLIYRCYDKVWSECFLELNFLNDSKYYFDLCEEDFKSNKNYRLLLKYNIYSIKLLRNKDLLINYKLTGKEK